MIDYITHVFLIVKPIYYINVLRQFCNLENFEYLNIYKKTLKNIHEYLISINYTTKLLVTVNTFYNERLVKASNYYNTDLSAKCPSINLH